MTAPPRQALGFPLNSYTPDSDVVSTVDRLQRVATRLLDVPIARVWLRPEVVRFSVESHVESHLAEANAAMAELGASALCRHVDGHGIPLVISDPAAQIAPAYESVVELKADMSARGWRAYLGVPLLASDGAAIGVLSVADGAPRTWTSGDVTLLVDLATLAADAHAAGGGQGLRWLNEVAHREAQVARRKNEERLSLIFNSTSDLTFLLAVEGDRRYRCVAVNHSYLAITGLSEQAVIGRCVDEFMTPDAAALTLDRYATAIAESEPVRYEECFLSPIGAMIVETTLTPIFDDDRSCCYLLGVARDVTGRCDAERKLQKDRDDAEAARLAAEEASQAKTVFLSRMSHELRTPLNSVIGFANVLLTNKGRKLDSRELSYVERIVTNGEHLLAVISDLLDISRLEAGKMPVTLTPLPLGPLVRTTAAGFESQLAGRPVTLHLEIPDRILRLRTDATKLQQVLINLIGNAIKFTDGGAITVRVVTDPVTARPLRLEVEDTGIGIPEHRQVAIFAAFEQAETGTARTYGGTGLGLAISRSLCQLLGFELSVHSAPGAGATFIVDLAPTPTDGTTALS